jgi:hypothetical protein
MWVGRRIESHWALHGLLVGTVAIILYLVVAWGRPEPLLLRIQAGVPESTMLALMGHMSRAMLERYSHIRMAVANVMLRPKSRAQRHSL